MPSGRTHDRITQFGTAAVLVGSMALWRRADVTLAATMSFSFAGFMFGPDLDIYSLQVKRWGPLQCIWKPYQSAIPHRAFWSHGVLAGTAIRIVYLAAWVLAVLAVVGGIITVAEWVTIGQPRFVPAQLDGAIALVQWLWWERQPWIWSVIIGLELGAFSHYASDWCVSAAKRATRPKPRSRRPGSSPARRSRRPSNRRPRRRTKPVPSRSER